jgi:SAM-dependent methyltransferase
MNIVSRSETSDATRECGLCQRRSYRLHYVIKGYRIGRCRGCGLIQVLDEVNDEQLRDLYDQNYYEGANEYVYQNYLARREDKIQDFEWRLNAICRQNNITQPGTCLEIGCAFGLFLEVARRRGWKTQGIELSSHSAKYAREYLGLDVSSEPSALQGIPAASQDLVLMWDVIEHLKEPMGVLHEIRRVLVPGGLLVLSTGDIGSLGAKLYGRKWHLLMPPYHLFYFDRRSVRKALVSSGLMVRHIGSYGHPLDNHNRPRLLAWIASHDRHIGWRLNSGPIMEVTAQAPVAPLRAQGPAGETAATGMMPVRVS